MISHTWFHSSQDISLISSLEWQRLALPFGSSSMRESFFWTSKLAVTCDAFWKVWVISILKCLIFLQKLLSLI